MANEETRPLPDEDELRRYRARFRIAKDAARRVAANLSEEEFSRSPPGGGWSISQCIDHLRTTGEQVVPRLERAVEDGRRRGVTGTGPFRYGRLGNWFVRMNEGGAARPSRRMRTPALYRPADGLPRAVVLPAFLDLQDRLTALAADADGLDLARIKVTSPASRMVRLSLGQWLALLAGHQERHLGQAARARNELGEKEA